MFSLHFVSLRLKCCCEEIVETFEQNTICYGSKISRGNKTRWFRCGELRFKIDRASYRDVVA